MNDIEDLKLHLPEYLESRGVDIRKASTSNTVCPICGNGSRTGCFHYFPDTEKVKCFSCGFNGDLIDLIAQDQGLDTKAAIAAAKKLFPAGGVRSSRKVTPTPRPAADFRDYYAAAEARNDFQYLQTRGISPAVQQRFHVGYDPEWISPKAIETTRSRGGDPARLPSSPRCIIPRSPGSYLARDVRQDLTQDQKKYAKQNQGTGDLFNLAALDESSTIFIVEGEIDCMSIYEAGGVAIGLGSTAHVRLLLNHLKDHYKGQRFILMLDNDEAGRKAQAELKSGLEALEAVTLEAEYPEEDPNTQLQSDRDLLTDLVSSLQAEALQIQSAAQVNSYNAADLLDYFRNIEQQPEGFEAKTGFKNLDREDRNFYGGLHDGLYIIGAVSSLGKTTFCLQIADQVAETGQDVIFFSLEQSKYELIAKSISRHTYMKNREATDTEGHFIARETAQILNNRRYKYYTPDEKKAIADGIAAYQKQAAHLFIYEGRYKGERLTVHSIRQIVKDHIDRTGNHPVVFLDYLQILAPEDSHSTDKQNTDAAVFELKEISRDFKIPVIAISSFNRENYQEPVSMTSFKESGAVEYSSDILLGLQFAGMDYIPGESDKDRKKRLTEMKTSNESKKFKKQPMDIELKCLKNRNGTQFTVMFRFVAAFNFYEEVYFNADDFPPYYGSTPFDKPKGNKKSI